MKERLDKFLAKMDIVPRKQVHKFLKAQLISVNGIVVKDRTTRIDTQKDVITYQGEPLTFQKNQYFMLNKPANVISTVSDELDRATVVSFIDTTREIYPIGRLDKDTRGLILLTTDGELTHKLIHPKYHVEKTYLLTITGKVDDEQLEKYKKGVTLDGKKTLPAIVKIIKEDDNTTMMQVTIHEGRFRQIRRTCEILGIKLTDLQRVSFGPLTLGNLPEGESRELTDKEVTSLQESSKGKK